MSPLRKLVGAGLLIAVAALAGCTVGPKYTRPSVPATPEYKETGNWKSAQPSDTAVRGDWWEVFGDQQLNQLEAQINISNQTLKAAEAQYAQARALVRNNRAGYFPQVTTSPSATRTRTSANRAQQVSSGTTFNDFILPVDVSYEADVWGRVRRSVESARENAQASAADLASVGVSMHAELASDYFQLRSLDVEEGLLRSTVSSYEQALQLTLNRYNGGIASEVDVAQARTQLETTRAQAIDIQVQRSQFEHAIAVLIGQPPARFSLAPSTHTSAPPQIPPGLPSQLLERRPDIAAAERRMAAANADIGIARAAYFPLVNLGASGGLESNAITTLLNGPSGFWSVGVGAFQTVFDGGRRRAVSDQAKAAYDKNVALYQQGVLTAFQEVEDNLAAQRILEQEAKTQELAVASARHSLELSNNRYNGGVTTYLEVLTAQTIALNDERLAVQTWGRRMTTTVLLIKALGGGWDTTQLPSLAQSGTRN